MHRCCAQYRIEILTRKAFVLVGFFVMISFIPLISHAQDCKRLDDGRYRVKFKKLGYDAFKYILLIDKDNFIEYRDGKEIKGKIAENANCTLRLDYLINPDSLDSFQKKLFSSMPYFEFEDTSRRKIRFRLTGSSGPHATAGEGKFVKVK